MGLIVLGLLVMTLWAVGIVGAALLVHGGQSVVLGDTPAEGDRRPWWEA